MPTRREKIIQKPHRPVNLSRLEALGDAIFAFALTLLALDLRIPEIAPDKIAQGILLLLPKLLVFVFAFLIIAQQWDVHQKTMLHIAEADSLFVWLYLLSLMFVVLMPASADMLGRYPLQPLALTFFGINSICLSLASWGMWGYASKRRRLLADDINAEIIRMIARLWLYPPVVIALTIPLGFFNVYLVYVIWALMPILSYSYSAWVVKRNQSSLR